MAVQSSTTNISIGKLADERGISRSNVSINQANIRELIGRSSGATNSTLSTFRGASRFFSGVSTFSFFMNKAPALNSDTEGSDSTSNQNPFAHFWADRFVYRTTNPVSTYYGLSTFSETADADFLVRNNSGAFQLWVRPGQTSRVANTSSVRSTWTYYDLFGGSQTLTWEYNYTTSNSSWGNNLNGRYNTYTPYYAGSSKALPTNGNYTQILNIPLAATGINSDTGADAVKVTVTNTHNRVGNGQGTHYNALTGTYWISSLTNGYRTPNSVTSNTNFNQGGHTTLVPNGTEYAMGPTTGYSFSVRSTTTAAYGNYGTHYDQDYKLTVQIKRAGHNRGQFRTVFAGHFALSTEIRCYNSGSIPVSIPIFESGF